MARNQSEPLNCTEEQGDTHGTHQCTGNFEGVKKPHEKEPCENQERYVIMPGTTSAGVVDVRKETKMHERPLPEEPYYEETKVALGKPSPICRSRRLCYSCAILFIVFNICVLVVSLGYAHVHEHDMNECATDPCMNNATCVDDVNGYKCNCTIGFDGNICQHNIDECASDPCLHGGHCKDHVNGHLCHCAQGWTGTLCETNIDECDSNPCLNGADCVDGISEYICMCQHGWTGTNCEQNIDECASDPCFNGGRCEDDVNGYLCHCARGWTGTTCEINIDECVSNPCLNSAFCDDGIDEYICMCQHGWTGTNCEQRNTVQVFWLNGESESPHSCGTRRTPSATFVVTFICSILIWYFY